MSVSYVLLNISRVATGGTAGDSSNTSSTTVTDLGDTFLDVQHILDSFPDSEITLRPPATAVTATADSEQVPANKTNIQKYLTTSAPYTVLVEHIPTATNNNHPPSSSCKKKVTVQNKIMLKTSPFPEDTPPLNTLRFTPTQVEAIYSGLNPGLTMIVGPPGTGKTDVTVQIISQLYHNHPTQKILIITHSNAALNDIFEKIMKRDVDPRHLLRLGSGEVELRESLAVAGAGMIAILLF